MSRRLEDSNDLFDGKRKRAREDDHEDLVDVAHEARSKRKNVRFSDQDDAFKPSKKDAPRAWDDTQDDDDDEDDDELEAKRKRKGQVNLEFSDDEEEDVNSKEAAPADDQDMFAAETPADKKQDTQPKKKGVITYMAPTQIEGQEWDAEAEEFDEEGTKMEPFNMDQELEEGGFDESGHYIAKQDDQAIHDNWLQGVTKNQMLLAKAAHDRQEARARIDFVVEEKTQGKLDANMIWYKILAVMKPGETVAGAMKRLGANSAKPKVIKAGWKNKIKSKYAESQSSDAMQVDQQAAEEQSKQAVNELTSLTDQLMGFGNFDVFEQRYEQIVRILRLANLIKEDWTNGDPLPPLSRAAASDDAESTELFWEYKNSEDTMEVRGPHTGEEMDDLVKRRQATEEGQTGPLWIRKVTRQTSLDPFVGFSVMPSGFDFVHG
ncbi:hypothetical protein SmJEL517_g03707 [Synchytrium microbalum]|uniref:GYF domain-containing protein n=1 Tax=Synchytrium microbalum TaxID=1806994 RepID=A0A507C0Z6_9FUNG|nr:uncharacterized protein SmJEL517_g03707 [Synchytrium microbalum]TPX33372.1 hypothetical protein SmJEL517_g03707 [Synchytrium microbalum]